MIEIPENYKKTLFCNVKEDGNIIFKDSLKELRLIPPGRFYLERIFSGGDIFNGNYHLYYNYKIIDLKGKPTEVPKIEYIYISQIKEFHNTASWPIHKSYLSLFIEDTASTTSFINLVPGWLTSYRELLLEIYLMNSKYNGSINKYKIGESGTKGFRITKDGQIEIEYYKRNKI